MVNRLFLSLLVFAVFAFFCDETLEAAAIQEMKYHGYSGIVDLSDIKIPDDEEIKEETLRRISAHITRRYHELGYRAFYIERVILKPDGVAEFYFNESVVSEIVISGISESESHLIRGLLYKTGEPYNEDILKKNIVNLKKSMGYPNIHVSLERDDNGGILIRGKIVKTGNFLNLSIQGDAVYGTIPRVTWNGIYDWGAVHFNFYSSFAQRSAEISGTSIFCDISLNEGRGLMAGFNAQWGSNFYAEEWIFRDRSISPEISIYSLKGSNGLAFFIKGGYYHVYDYPESGSIEVYSGFSGLRFFYNDSRYRIDQRDARRATLDISAGKNSLEDVTALRVESDIFIPSRLYRRADLVFKNSFFLTSENERLFHRYVFDNQLPGRAGDYLTSDFKNSSGIEIPLEIYPSLISLGPIFYYGVYRVDRSRYESSTSAGLFLSITPGKLLLNFSYVYDTSFKMSDGVFLFAVTGSF